MLDEKREEHPSAMMGGEDGSVVGYMCLTDWEYEIGSASGGALVHPSIDDLKRKRKCATSCGIIEVRVTASRVVQDPEQTLDDMDGEQN